MPITAALAAVAVADVDRARTFYETVFGRPAQLADPDGNVITIAEQPTDG